MSLLATQLAAAAAAPAAVKMPFEGLESPWQGILTIVLIVALSMLVWTTILFIRGQRARRRAPAPDELGAERYSWVFIVPALNEEKTITDSVSRLLALPLARRKVVVIDDGSDDATPLRLAAIDHPDLVVLRREPPDARTGKTAALNHAYFRLPEVIGETPREEVITCVVDADGRIPAAAPGFVAAQFADDDFLGGVQSLVRIYNRKHLFTWFQDVEFGVYGNLFQSGRNAWGTAGMGGNGQYNRLAALDSICEPQGPWQDSLSEDQNLGLRLIAAGWNGRQELRATVDQQGLPRFLPLLRQRTRWSQGNLQSMGLIGDVMRDRRHGLIARIETVAYLLMPFWQGIIGAGMLVALYLLASGQAEIFHYDDFWQLAFFYLLGFGGTMMGAIAARANDGALGWLKGVLIGQVYAFYSWMIWPVLLRSAARQLTDRRGWAKTEREAIDEDAFAEPAVVEDDRAAA